MLFIVQEVKLYFPNKLVLTLKVKLYHKFKNTVNGLIVSIYLFFH
jgi:hypothetical protein